MSDHQEYIEARQKIRQNRSDRMAKLTESEQEWKNKTSLLVRHGYRLRPRYQEGWTPSWVGRDVRMQNCEDWYRNPRPQLIDATRIADNRLVYIKRIENDNEETKIALKLYDEALRVDPRNHSIPVLDVFPDDVDPTVSYMVMPFLRLMNDPPFGNVDEVIEFVDQVLDGLVFMHEHGVAHRDCTVKNLMMDADSLYPKGFHPVETDYLPDVSGRAPYLSRTEASVKYYFVDYDISVQIPDDGRPKLATGDLGRDRDVPELEWDRPYDPFKMDVFIIGNVLKKEFCENFSNVEFLRPLATSMTAADPDSRPDATEAQRYWREIRSNVTSLQRKNRLKGRDETLVQTAVLDVFSFVKLGFRISSDIFGRVLRLLYIIRGAGRRQS